MTVSGAAGIGDETSDDVSLKVTEDGVKITAQSGNDIKINNTVFKNTDTTGNGDLVITVEPNGTPKLEEGSTILPAGEKIKLPNGELIEVTGGDIQIDANGNIIVPTGTTTDVTITVTDTNGKKHTYVVPAPSGDEGSTSDVKFNINQGNNVTSPIPKLEAGETVLGAGSQVAIKDGDTIITSAGPNGTTVNENGNINLPSGSGVKVDSTITNNGQTIKTSYDIVAPSTNDGSVNAQPNSNGGYDITVNKRNDTVKVNGDVGGDKFATEFTTTENNTKLNVSDKGTTLEQGGVVLDGGKTPKESINVNGSGITNTGNSSIKVTKVTTGETTGTNLNVGAGGSFELFNPGDPDSAIKFTNPGMTEADYSINTEGSILLGSGDEIAFNTSNNLPITLQGSNNVAVNVADNGVEVTVPSGETVTINGKTYTAADSELKIVIDNNGNKIITSGTAQVPAGESVYVKDANGKLTEIKKNAETGNMKVSADGKVNANAGDEIIIGDGKYVSKDAGSSTGFDLALDPATGKVTLTDGKNLGVTNGNIVIGNETGSDNPSGGTTNGSVSVSTTGNKEVLVEMADNETKPTIKIPSGGNATIDDGNNGSGVEIIVPETTNGNKQVTMDEGGNLSVELEPGEQITIAGVKYTADEEQTGNTTLKIDGATGSLISSTGGSVETEIDKNNFNKPNYSYDVPANEKITIDGVEYKAPAGGMTIIGNPNGNPIIEVNKAGQSVTIGGKEYTAGSDGTQFIVNSEGNVSLVGSGSSIIVNAPDTMYVDGNKVVASGTGNATITKKADGSNTLTADRGVQTNVTLGNKAPLNLAGTTATVNGSTYSAPEDGITLTSNGVGKKPTVTINEANTAVQIDGVGYTAGNDKTQFIVNSTNNVTLVDNNNSNANSALVVKNPREMVIDGNTIKADGQTTGGYTITKTSEGNSISIKNGTILDVTMGSAGSDITVNENVYYNDKPTSGNTTTFTTDKSGTQIVLDKRFKDSEGNYITDLKPAGTTTLTPQENANGEIIGFEATKPSTPVKPPSNNGNNGGGTVSPTPPSTSGSQKEEVEEELEESEELEDNEDTNESIGREERDELETDEDSEMLEENSSGDSSDNGNDVTVDTTEPEETSSEPLVVVEVNDVEETVDIPVTANMEVAVEEGTITVQTEGDIVVASDLNTFINAILTDKEIKKVKNGERVEVRFTTTMVKKEHSHEEKEVLMKAYEEFAIRIDGLQISEFYDIVIERRIGNGDWKVVSELREPIEITVEIPEELRKEGRTYYLLRNHDGTCMILEDIDTEQYTITAISSDFSVYSIAYTDADVESLDIDNINKEVVNTMKGSNNILLWILILLVVVGGMTAIYNYQKKRKN